MATGRKAFHMRKSPPKGSIIAPLAHLEERVLFIAYKAGSVRFNEHWDYEPLYVDEEEMFFERWSYDPFLPVNTMWEEPWNPSDFEPDIQEFNEQWEFGGFGVEPNFNESWNPSSFSPGTAKFSESWEAPIS